MLPYGTYDATLGVFSQTDSTKSVPLSAAFQSVMNVSPTPAPNCVFMDFEASYGRYAVRYWLTDLAVDDPTDSLVRVRIYFALKRAGTTATASPTPA